MNSTGTHLEIGKAVIIAMLSAAAVKLIEWGVEELKARAKKAPEKADKQ